MSNKHRSGYSARWLTSMFARKQVTQVSDVHNETLRQKVRKAAKSEKDQDEMLKDIHLLEAAIATDKTVISLNQSDRVRFKGICDRV